jgi:aminomethyltransferase
MDESVNPYACGLTWTVDLNDEDREFIGKQAFLNINEKDEQKMIGILLKDKGILRPGYEITHKDGKGTVLSGTFSPTLKKSIGLARVDQTVEKSGLVKIRNKELEIEFVPPRFLKKI